MNRVLISTLVLLSCGFTDTETNVNSSARSSGEQTKEFNAYWYAGQAEVSTYDISYARYGELREGKSTVVFVTEDMLLEEQVKKEMASDKTATSVMKMNKIDRFTTGIYDYSLMQSTFTPVDPLVYPYVLKTVFSSQDWCGQSFMQLNRRGMGYQALVRSYFEGEGDKSNIIDDVVLEDALWTLARLSPHTLPTGKFDILPSSANVLLLHEPAAPVMAIGTLNLQVSADETEQFIYKVALEDGREFTLFLQAVFPFRIYGWEEKVQTRGEWLTTKAILDKSIKSSYWGESATEFDGRRKELGLKGF